MHSTLALHSRLARSIGATALELLHSLCLALLYLWIHRTSSFLMCSPLTQRTINCVLCLCLFHSVLCLPYSLLFCSRLCQFHIVNRTLNFHDTTPGIANKANVEHMNKNNNTATKTQKQLRFDGKVTCVIWVREHCDQMLTNVRV